MKIKLTAKNIRLGKNHMTSSSLCPVALAFRQAGFKNVLVGVDFANNVLTGAEVRLPRMVVKAIKTLIDDCITHDKTVKPFSFTITKKQAELLRQSY